MNESITIADITSRKVNHWLSHADGDEMFIVLNGTLYLDTESETITLTTGQSYTVSSGMSHRARAKSRVELIAISKGNPNELV